MPVYVWPCILLNTQVLTTERRKDLIVVGSRVVNGIHNKNRRSMLFSNTIKANVITIE